MLPYHSEFYQLESRPEHKLRQWWDSVVAAVEEWSSMADCIATHNPWGEYGMLDHCLVHRCVTETSPKPILWTNAFFQTATWPVGPRRAVNCNPVNRVELPMDIFKRCQDEYKRRGCWTWDHPVPDNVAIFERR